MTLETIKALSHVDTKLKPMLLDIKEPIAETEF